MAEPASRAERGPARVLMVADRFPQFSATFLVSKFLGLLKRGWEVHVACSQSDPAQWELYPDLPPRSTLANRVHVTSNLSSVVTDVKPDLVHFELGHLAHGHIDLARRGGLKIVVSFRGADLNFRGLDDPRYYQDVWATADALHFRSEDLWRRAQRRGCPSEMTRYLIHPGIDVAFFDPHERRHRLAAGTPGRPLRIVSVARLHWKKGHEYALQAVRLLEDADIRCEYRIIGGEDSHRGERNHLLFTIHDLGLERVASSMGTQPRSGVKESLLWADVFLHAAVSEGSCNAVLEAEAMRLPVVVTDADGLGEMAADGETGFVVPRRDPAALASELALLAKDPRLRQRLGAAGRERVCARFSVDQEIDAFDHLYRQVLSTVNLEPVRDMLEPVRDIRQTVEGCVPVHSTVIVVSKGDADLLRLRKREGWHFPQTETGVYAGYHPESSAEAISHLESLREKGGNFLLFPSTAVWWLEYYDGFREHLEKRYRKVTQDDDPCIIFALEG